jgi:nucleoside-diphosphate-sugar epimerase
MIKSGRMMLPQGGKGMIQPIFVDDTVEGIMLAAERGGIGESYLLAGSEAVTCRDFFGYYADMVGKSRVPSVPAVAARALAVFMTGVSRITGKPAQLTLTAVRGLCLQATYDGDKARRVLGFEPKTDLATGMAAVRQWLKEAV